jgi:hypothetical protein
VDGSTRRTRFEARVSLERDFLTRVNQAFGGSEPLAGMTLDAIESWRKRAKTVWPAVDMDRLARLLLAASSRAELLADNSKEVFESEHRPPPNSLNEIRMLLEQALAEETPARV